MKRETFFKSAIGAAFIGFIFCFGASMAWAQTTAFTYQGRLTDGATAATGTYDLGFALYDADTAGTQIGTAITRSNVAVSGGIFTVQLDFGATAFAAGANRFLQIAVKKTTETAFITLTPRQQLTASPYSIRTISAGVSDALSANCVGCVTNAQINSIDGAKVTGTVASATTAATATSATTAGNVTGVVAIANGGTGSATKNFVDTTTAQTVGGNKTFSNIVTANTLSAGTGGLNMNNNIVRLRDSADNNHGMIYNSTVDGPEFRAFGGFRWVNGNNGATQRMSLDSSGNLSVSGNLTSANITATGTITGTLADNSVSEAQVVDGSLRLTDLSIFGTTSTLGPFTIGANGCVGFNANLPSGTTAIGDILYVYFQNTTPAGFYVQPTITTSLTANAFYICNSLNTSNTFPAQTVRIAFVRP